jgi:hypothetical protein
MMYPSGFACKCNVQRGLTTQRLTLSCEFREEKYYMIDVLVGSYGCLLSVDVWWLMVHTLGNLNNIT